MSESQTLYRKYRPQTFDEVAGQRAVIRILRTALETGKLTHAYLFTGPRGTGKTTTARLFAKALNCLNAKSPTPSPCNECASCIGIRDGHSMDVIEMDAASNRGIDEIRELRESVRFPPVLSRKKIYIIDESHMLSKDACNALLKTLEEPPGYVVFILATTDPNRMPSTVLSRCQRYDFNRLSAQDLKPYLRRIVEQEGYAVEDDKVYDLLYVYAEGAARDAVGLLEQLALMDNRRISEKTVVDLLGVPEKEAFFNLLKAVARRDFRRTLQLAGEACERGTSFWGFVNTLTALLRDLLVVKQGLRPVDPYREEEIATLQELARAFPYAALFALFERLGQFRYVFKWETEGRLLWDIAFLELFRTLEGMPEQPGELDASAGAGASSKGGKPAASGPPTGPPVAENEYRAEAPKKPELKDSGASVAPGRPPTPLTASAPLPAAQPVKPAEPPAEPTGVGEFLWEGFVEFVAGVNPSLAALLIRGKPARMDDEAITVGFPRSFGLPRTFLRRSSMILEMERHLREYTQQDLKFKMGELEEETGGNGGLENGEPLSPQVQQVLQFFPGSRKVN